MQVDLAADSEEGRARSVGRAGLEPEGRLRGPFAGSLARSCAVLVESCAPRVVEFAPGRQSLAVQHAIVGPFCGPFGADAADCTLVGARSGAA